MNSHQLGPYTVFFENPTEFHYLVNEIFHHHCYYLEIDKPDPVILDAGAHIGLTVLYFKKQFPASRITALEPHPDTFKLLQTNLSTNHLADIKLELVALDTQSGTRPFYADTQDNWHSTAGFTQGGWTGKQVTQQLQVKTKPLADYLTQPIDILKLDIEAAEYPVLKAAQKYLQNVKHLLVEHHPVQGYPLSKLKALLESSGFIVENVTPEARSQDLSLLYAH